MLPKTKVYKKIVVVAEVEEVVMKVKIVVAVLQSIVATYF
jgi:hypothetical protein